MFSARTKKKLSISQQIPARLANQSKLLRSQLVNELNKRSI